MEPNSDDKQLTDALFRLRKTTRPGTRCALYLIISNHYQAAGHPDEAAEWLYKHNMLRIKLSPSELDEMYREVR